MPTRAGSAPWRAGRWAAVSLALLVLGVVAEVWQFRAAWTDAKPLATALMAVEVVLCLLGVAALALAVHRADPEAERKPSVRAPEDPKGTLLARFGRRWPSVDVGYLTLLAAGMPLSLVADAAARRVGTSVLGGLLLALALLSWAVALAGRIVRAPSLCLDAESLELSSRRGVRRVSVASLVSVEAAGDTLSLRLRGGRRWRCSLRWLSRAERDTLVSVLGARVIQPPDEDEAARLGALDREGRSLAEWREALTALCAARESYRAPALSREDLVRALENPWTPIERRIGAALALAGLGDHEASTRIRVAARGCEDRRVGAALVRVAAGTLDEPTVEKALRARG